MKTLKYIISLGLLLSFSLLYSQNYNISSYNNNVISTCSGNLFDSGGPNGNYNSNETYTVTICPTIYGNATTLDFNYFTVSPGDALEIFDGPTIYSNSIGVFTSFVSPVNANIQASIGNSTGCLTLKWTSTSSNIGWKAVINCNIPCQTFEATLQSSVPPFTIDSGIYYIDICLGDSIFLDATGTYTYNDNVYHQSNTTSSFSWKFGNGTVSNSQSTSVLYDSISGYLIDLEMTDSLGCENSTASDIRVRVSTTPSFDGTFASESILCALDTFQLSGSFTPKLWETIASLNVAGVTYLPDGSGVSYTSDLTFGSFGVGQVLTSANDISVFANIEHSYLGDLQISINCPNGQSAILKSYPGGTSTYLGEPIDNNAAQIPGIGYEYHWNESGSTTMLAAVGSYSYSYTDALGNPVSNHNFLPPSVSYPANATANPQSYLVNYLPEQSFSNLVGCPLNGTWSITVTDNLAIDNGFIFNWGIDFNQNILPASWDYTPNADSSYWNYSNTIVGNNGDNVTILPDTGGVYNYTFTVIDDFGCSFDTTINVHVKPLPDLNLGSDTIVCDNGLTLDVTTTPSASYMWQDSSMSPVYTVDTSSIVWVSITDSSCTISDTLDVILSEGPVFSVRGDTVCFGNIAKLEADSDSNFTYQWENGSVMNYTIVNPNSSQYFQVEVFDTIGCSNIDSAYAMVVPLPDLTISDDQTICKGDSVTLKINGAQSYLWSNGDTVSFINVSPNSTTVYEVLGSNIECKDSIEVEVTVIPFPNPIITTELDTICLGSEILLTAEGGDNYIWNSGSISPDILVSPSENSTFRVLVSNEANGLECSEYATKSIFVERCNKIYVPTAFSPDSDGFNDLFYPAGNFEYVEYIEMYIYDRFGRLIYQSNSVNKGWDGRINGVQAPPGVYTYLLKIKEMKIDLYTKAGTFHLIK